jgi:hypothetical protein
MGWRRHGPAHEAGLRLRRSTGAWDDEELGSAYNRAVVMRLGHVKPYKFRALSLTARW